MSEYIPFTYIWEKDIMRKSVKNWDARSAMDQLCGSPFECEEGHLASFDAFVWLGNVLQAGPLFLPGQTVYRLTSGTIDGVYLERWADFTVCGIRRGAGAWLYALTRGEINASRLPTIVISDISESELQKEPQ